MKAIILAAGMGSRLKKYTENLPKGMLAYQGKTLIERQIETYRRNGISDIIIVRGFAAKKINYADIKYFDNKNYSTTNMVESLLQAKSEFNDDIIVSYSDIVFEDKLLKKMISSNVDYGVAVDDNWKVYWNLRYGKIDFDTESLAIDSQDNITELGKDSPALESIDARYIGLLKFSKNGLSNILSIMEDAQKSYKDKPWQQSGIPGMQAYMTDLLNALIQSGAEVKAIHFNNGWLEFDTNEDYEKAVDLSNLHLFQKICNVI